MPKLKNKTDEFFSQMLQNHEVKPREQAWQKLESNLRKKEKKAIPIWRQFSFAATFALLFFVGIIAYFNGIDKTQNPKPSFKTNIGEVASTKNESNTNLISKPEKIEFTKGEANNFNLNSNPNLSKKKKFESEVLLTRSAIKMEKQSPINSELLVENDIANALSTNENNPIQQLENKIEITDSKNIVKKEEELTVIFTIANFKNENIEENTNVAKTQSEKKEKYINRLFKQLKNAKNGDKVDWDMVGFKPTKILARAENKFNSTKEEVSGSYQLVKNKTVF